jgi:chemotaxis-related protein WspB
MLYLLFHLGADRFALDVRQIAEALPLVRFTTLPQAPRGVAGLFNYHGTSVPALDLSAFIVNRPARSCLSTRLIVTHYPAADGAQNFLGLIAERATETLRRKPDEFVPAGFRSEVTPFLGPVTADARGLIQLIELDKLLPPILRDLLFMSEAQT